MQETAFPLIQLPNGKRLHFLSWDDNSGVLPNELIFSLFSQDERNAFELLVLCSLLCQ